MVPMLPKRKNCVELSDDLHFFSVSRAALLVLLPHFPELPLALQRILSLFVHFDNNDEWV